MISVQKAIQTTFWSDFYWGKYACSVSVDIEYLCTAIGWVLCKILPLAIGRLSDDVSQFSKYANRFFVLGAFPGWEKALGTRAGMCLFSKA